MAQAAVPLMVLQAGMALFEGRSQSQALKADARVDQENARLTELQGAIEGSDIRRRARATQGEAISALADNGVSVGDGSAQDLLFQNALEAEYAVMNARYSAATEARGLRMSAAQKKQAARSAMIGGVLRAGAAALSGVSNMQNAKAEAGALQRREAAFFPGGQRLPTPAGRNVVGPRY